MPYLFMTESTAHRNPFIIILITLLVSFFGFQVAGSLIGFFLAIPFCGFNVGNDQLNDVTRKMTPA